MKYKGLDTKKKGGKKLNITIRRRVINYYNKLILFVKILLIIIVFLFIFTDYFSNLKYKIGNYITSILVSNHFILEELLVEGNKNTHIDTIIKIVIDSTIHNMPYDKNHNSIFEISLDMIHKQLLNTTWVTGALIERRLPNHLHILITEHVPIAIWQLNNKLFLIDKYGNRITDKDIDKLCNLIHVIGPDANINAATLIDDLNKYPKLAEHILHAQRVGQRRWKLLLKQDITIEMPEKHFNKAYNYLNDLYAKNKLFNLNINTLDLRDIEKYYLEQKK